MRFLFFVFWAVIWVGAAWTTAASSRSHDAKR